MTMHNSDFELAYDRLMAMRVPEDDLGTINGAALLLKQHDYTIARLRILMIENGIKGATTPDVRTLLVNLEKGIKALKRKADKAER